MQAYNPGIKDLGLFQHTEGHINCSLCAGALIMQHQKLTPDLLFREAFDLWLLHRTIPAGARSVSARYLAEKTVKDYKVGAKALEKFFGKMHLGDIHSGHIAVYQDGRLLCDQKIAKWAKPAGANCVRKEIALLLRLLREVGKWKEEDDKSLVRVQAEENDVSRALTLEEQNHFLHVAAAKEQHGFIYRYALLALDTTCSAKELRCLRLGDICLADGLLMVRKASAKNKYRIRTIPIASNEAMWALGQLIERARELGSSSPQHYLFPMYSGYDAYDPMQPMSEWGLAKRFDAVRDEAGLRWFMPNGFRHTALTRLAENGTPIHVMLARAGHIRFLTQKHYISIGLASQRRWAQASIVSPLAGMAKDLVPKKPPVSVKVPAAPAGRAASGYGASLTWIGTTRGF